MDELNTAALLLLVLVPLLPYIARSDLGAFRAVNKVFRSALDHQRERLKLRAWKCRDHHANILTILGWAPNIWPKIVTLSIDVHFRHLSAVVDAIQRWPCLKSLHFSSVSARVSRRIAILCYHPPLHAPMHP
jgi:hypothetical protein